MRDVWLLPDALWNTGAPPLSNPVGICASEYLRKTYWAVASRFTFAVSSYLTSRLPVVLSDGLLRVFLFTMSAVEPASMLESRESPRMNLKCDGGAQFQFNPPLTKCW